jgi:hypothetical protein
MGLAMGSPSSPVCLKAAVSITSSMRQEKT